MNDSGTSKASIRSEIWYIYAIMMNKHLHVTVSFNLKNRWFFLLSILLSQYSLAASYDPDRIQIYWDDYGGIDNTVHIQYSSSALAEKKIDLYTFNSKDDKADAQLTIELVQLIDRLKKENKPLVIDDRHYQDVREKYREEELTPSLVMSHLIFPDANPPELFYKDIINRLNKVRLTYADVKRGNVHTDGVDYFIISEKIDAVALTPENLFPYTKLNLNCALKPNGALNAISEESAEGYFLSNRSLNIKCYGSDLQLKVESEYVQNLKYTTMARQGTSSVIQVKDIEVSIDQNFDYISGKWSNSSGIFIHLIR